MTRNKATRKQAATSIDTPMTHDNAGSYAIFFKNEPKTAAYLGYTDIAEFRKFRFSGPVVEAFLLFQEHCQNRTPRTPLRMIECSSNCEDNFPADPNAMLAKYLPDADANPRSHAFRDSIYATVIYRLAETIEAMPSMSVQELTDRHAQASSKFEAVFNTFTLPTFDITTLRYPQLGPFHDIGEIDLEKYSRVNALLKSLQSAIAPSRWAEMFGKASFDPFVFTEISPDSTPSWMRATDSTANLPLMTTNLTRPSRPKKTFTLSLDRSQRTKHSMALDEHITTFIIFNSLHLPPQHCLAAKDPRAFPTGEMWRDTVRRQLNLLALQVDFLSIHIVQCDSDSDSIPAQGILVYDSYLLNDVKPWTDLLAFLESPAPGFRFRYTLQVIDVDADNEYYEYNGPPLAIQEEFEVASDNDIGLHQLTLADPQQSQEDEVDPGSTPVDRITRQNISDFLSGGGVAPRVQATPQAMFTADQREQMLEYHSSFNVFSAPELLKWQHYVLDKVCGAVPKPTKERNTLQLSKQVREELQMAQKSTELSTLSADVSPGFSHTGMKTNHCMSTIGRYGWQSSTIL